MGTLWCGAGKPAKYVLLKKDETGGLNLGERER